MKSGMYGRRPRGKYARRIFELEQAIRSDIEAAEAVCGGDGQGCAAFRPYYDNAARRHAKCGQCPMDALSNVRHVLAHE